MLCYDGGANYAGHSNFKFQHIEWTCQKQKTTERERERESTCHRGRKPKEKKKDQSEIINK